VPLWKWKGAAVGTLIGEGFLAAAAWFSLVTLERRHDREKAACRAAVMSMTSEPAPSGAH